MYELRPLQLLAYIRWDMSSMSPNNRREACGVSHVPARSAHQRGSRQAGAIIFQGDIIAGASMLSCQGYAEPSRTPPLVIYPAPGCEDDLWPVSGSGTHRSVYGGGRCRGERDSVRRWSAESGRVRSAVIRERGSERVTISTSIIPIFGLYFLCGLRTEHGW